MKDQKEFAFAQEFGVQVLSKPSWISFEFFQ